MAPPVWPLLLPAMPAVAAAEGPAVSEPASPWSASMLYNEVKECAVEPACVTIEHASSVAPVMPIAGVHCCCCCCMPAALLGLGPAPRDPASLARPAPAALLVLLLVLPIVLRASCSPEPTVAAGELSTGMSLQMLLVVVEGSADSSTSLPALRPALCLPGPLGGRVASAGAAVSDSPPHDRQRRAFCTRLCKVCLGRPVLLSCSCPACCRASFPGILQVNTGTTSVTHAKLIRHNR